MNSCAIDRSCFPSFSLGFFSYIIDLSTPRWANSIVSSWAVSATKTPRCGGTSAARPRPRRRCRRMRRWRKSPGPWPRLMRFMAWRSSGVWFAWEGWGFWGLVWGVGRLGFWGVGLGVRFFGLKGWICFFLFFGFEGGWFSSLFTSNPFWERLSNFLSWLSTRWYFWF